MTQQEVKAMVNEMIETKCNEGLNRIKNMPMCGRMYASMNKQGFKEEAKIFKSIIFYTAIIHPDWSEKEIIANFAKEVGLV